MGATQSIDAFFLPDGPLASDGDPYAFRPQQLDYALAVGSIISRNGVGLVEGGTGIGKTFGYLVPHILEATRSGKRALIATRTKNLQDQIFLKDLPRLAKALDFRYAVLKGRENYVCAERLREESSNAEIFTWDSYGRALKYLREFDRLHPTGDLESAQRFIRRYGADGARAIREVRAIDDTCTSDHRYLCRHYKALAAAEKADVIIANHHLALVWPDHYPEVGRVVIDEAHALEEAATDVFGAAWHGGALHFRLRRLHAPRRGRRGLLDRFSQREQDEFQINRVIDRIDSVKRAIEEMQRASADFLEKLGAGASDRPARINPEHLLFSEWTILCETSGLLGSALRRLSRELSLLIDSITGLDRFRFVGEKLLRAAEGFDAQRAALESIFQCNPVAGTILWTEPRRDRQPLFRRAPVDISETMRASFFEKYDSVVLTSATLQAGGSFDFITRRLGLSPPPNGAEPVDFFDRVVTPFEAGHPFDYRSKVLLCLLRAEDAPDQARTIERLAAISSGRMLALFTNKTRMLDVASRVRVEPFEVVAQHRDGGRHELAAALRARPGRILFGTRSFWEGLDIPGRNLSIVVIEKVPFTNPGDPVYDARCEALGDRWFPDFALPSALLTLRQGFGRLIRSESDAGVVVILDPGRRSYLNRIRKSLPDCETIEGNEAVVFARVAEFFAELDSASP